MPTLVADLEGPLAKPSNRRPALQISVLETQILLDAVADLPNIFEDSNGRRQAHSIAARLLNDRIGCGEGLSLTTIEILQHASHLRCTLHIIAEDDGSHSRIVLQNRFDDQPICKMTDEADCEILDNMPHVINLSGTRFYLAEIAKEKAEARMFQAWTKATAELSALANWAIAKDGPLALLRSQ